MLLVHGLELSLLLSPGMFCNALLGIFSQKIFEAESLREKAQWMAAKQAKRGSAGQHDVGETPHNSPSAARDQLVSDADSPAKIEMDCNSSRTQCLADASVTSGLVDEEPSNSYGLETFG